ncbi:MAG: DNA alkylation repair protein [Ignavibacteriales bacterium]|nr:DNA alkylation repair protein [Ignavibacteriales bacterium]
MHLTQVIKELKRMADPAIVKGMSRFGVPSEHALGISAPQLRLLARRIGKDQKLSLKLWTTGILEARAIAALTGDPDKVAWSQMGRWAKDFDSWAVCDACCGALFVRTPYALKAAFEWCRSEDEFVKRAGFVMMAEAAIHLKSLDDSKFLPMLKEIRLGAVDERNFVRKAVNWALRQIGKRNLRLNKLAIADGERIRLVDSRSARWIAADALRELRSPQVQHRLQKWERESRSR